MGPFHYPTLGDGTSPMKCHPKMTGFTLVELVIVIVITGIITVVVTNIITTPIDAFVDSSRRARLVDDADLALRRMARDIRRALPNSIRTTGTGQVLEILNTVDAGRYRDDPPPGNAASVLDFTQADDEFDVIGELWQFAAIDTSSDALVVYNLNAVGGANNAYAGDNRATLDAATTDSHIMLATSIQFPLASPRQRFYIIDTPVTYLCDAGAGVVRRYDSYTIAASQSSVDSAAELLAAGADEGLMTRYVAACSFTYQVGTPQRAGLALLRLELSDGGEGVVLQHQVHVHHAP